MDKEHEAYIRPRVLNECDLSWQDGAALLGEIDEMRTFMGKMLPDLEHLLKTAMGPMEGTNSAPFRLGVCAAIAGDLIDKIKVTFK